MTQEEIKAACERVDKGEQVQVFHKIKGKGEIVSYRADKLSNNRIKAKINYIIPDLLEDVIKPEFSFLDEENISLQ